MDSTNAQDAEGIYLFKSTIKTEFKCFSDDVHKMLNLMETIEELEMENKKIREEFNVQRAKMKDLFLLKEGSGFGSLVGGCCNCFF